MFDDAALVREWGRLGSLGRRRVDPYAKVSDARLALGVWLERKIRRGYVERFCENPIDAA